MHIIRKPLQDDIERAAKALKDGHLVAFPTETVYGLGADATNEKAVSRIYSVKGRPIGHPLIVHISSINNLDKWATNIPDFAIRLARVFWPGPLTLILPRTNLAKDSVTGGQNNVGLRVPAQSVALNLLKNFEDLGGKGVAAPSANRFGAVSPTEIDAVKEELGDFLLKDDIILNGGLSGIGIESTIIDCTKNDPLILRSGAITAEMIETTCGLDKLVINDKDSIKTSGQFKSHYSPKAKVTLNRYTEDGEGFLAMSNIYTPPGAIRLASPSTIEEYARDLYKALRLGDKKKLNKINVIAPQGAGLAEAIRDRLDKAAGKKGNN
jgi:L-threonylcarbamoyladenylate synthase